MRLTIRDIQQMKEQRERIPMLTAYDYTSAKILDRAGVPLLLVGDSLGQTMLGYGSTLPVTMDEMIHHTKAVVRGTERALVVGDMPFMSYQVSQEEAVRNAGRFLQEAGAQVVKLEGGVTVARTVKRIVECGIPVMGHIGLTPQSVHQLGGFRVQGRTPQAAVRLLQDAQALEEAGAFAVVLELVPAPLAKLITERCSVPTIGIGAGPSCDGQVLVFHDFLGIYPDFVPKHTKLYAHLAETITQAVGAYMKEVQEGSFPAAEHSFSMDPAILSELTQTV